MSKPVAVILLIIGWAGVILAMNFSKIVPHASPQEVKPFLTGAWVFAIVVTLLAIKSLSAKSQ